MPSSVPKPAEVAAEAKKHYIPLIRGKYKHQWPTQSYLFRTPLQQIHLPSLGPLLPPKPDFYVCAGDPAQFAIDWQKRVRIRIPFICVANDKRPGGDWETGTAGYEEQLCRRSTLSATLSTPGSGSQVGCHYPIPSEGGIYSEFVVVFRGPPDKYEKLEEWHDLPVVSMPALKCPKLNQSSLRYAFPLERDLTRNKIRSALRICAYYGHKSVVVGDFGLGNTHRNPPDEVAELWRDVILFDPEIRGRFEHIAFVFEDPYRSTTKLILEDIAKKYNSKSGHSNAGKGKSKQSTSSSSSSSSRPARDPTRPSDFETFQRVFNSNEIHNLMNRQDPRYDISMLTS